MSTDTILDDIPSEQHSEELQAEMDAIIARSNAPPAAVAEDGEPKPKPSPRDVEAYRAAIVRGERPSVELTVQAGFHVADPDKKDDKDARDEHAANFKHHVGLCEEFAELLEQEAALGKRKEEARAKDYGAILLTDLSSVADLALALECFNQKRLNPTTMTPEVVEASERKMRIGRQRIELGNYLKSYGDHSPYARSIHRLERQLQLDAELGSPEDIAAMERRLQEALFSNGPDGHEWMLTVAAFHCSEPPEPTKGKPVESRLPSGNQGMGSIERVVAA